MKPQSKMGGYKMMFGMGKISRGNRLRRMADWVGAHLTL